MSKLKMYVIILSCLALLTAFTGCTSEADNEIVISIPYNEYIRSIDTNYYKEWLEEQTGLSIKFNVVHEALTADYLRSMFASGYVKSDAFFSILNSEDLTDCNTILQEFGEKGYIIPLNAYVEKSTYLNAIFKDYSEDNLRSGMTSSDGNMYYMPGFDSSISEGHYQVLWLNQGWLKRLKLKIPQTTEEFRDVLVAFKNMDPNGNGKQDELPLTGSRDMSTEQCFNFIINAFVYNDPDNSRLFKKNGTVHFAPMTDEWREAMKYLRGLYADDLISPFQFTLGHSVTVALANEPQNVLGSFAAKSITDIIFYDNPEILHDFVHVAPLTGPAGARNATVRTSLPKPAGVITSSCKNPEDVFKLFDLMLSEEAFLIGRYGEKGVDWIPAHSTDMDAYGNKATVRVINQLQNMVQNKHICELGPFFAYPQYADGVTFLGFEADHEYVNAMAYRLYEQYRPDEYIKTICFDGDNAQDLQVLRKSIDSYTDESIKAFITGGKDPFDDATWETHLRKYKKMGIDTLIGAIKEDCP